MFSPETVYQVKQEQHQDRLHRLEQAQHLPAATPWHYVCCRRLGHLLQSLGRRLEQYGGEPAQTPTAGHTKYA